MSFMGILFPYASMRNIIPQFDMSPRRSRARLARLTATNISPPCSTPAPARSTRVTGRFQSQSTRQVRGLLGGGSVPHVEIM